MQKYFILPLLVLFCSFTNIDEWVTTLIDKKVSIDMPKKAEKEKSNGSLVFVSDNEGAVFLVTLTPISSKIPIPTEPQELAKFLDGVLDGALKASKPQNVQRKDVKIGNTIGKEATFMGNFPMTDVQAKAVKQILLIDHTLYTFDFWITDEEYQGLSTDQEKFFTSIKISD